MQKFHELRGLPGALVHLDQFADRHRVGRVVLDGLGVERAEVVPALGRAQKRLQGFERLRVGGIAFEHLLEGRDGLVALGRIFGEQAAHTEGHGFRFIRFRRLALEFAQFLQELFRLASRFGHTLGVGQQAGIARGQAQRHHQHGVGAIRRGQLFVEHQAGFVEICGLLTDLRFEFGPADERIDDTFPLLVFTQLGQTQIQHVLGFAVPGIVGQAFEPGLDLVDGRLVAAELAGLRERLDGISELALDGNGH